jgi:hypothetical protein
VAPQCTALIVRDGNDHNNTGDNAYYIVRCTNKTIHDKSIKITRRVKLIGKVITWSQPIKYNEKIRSAHTNLVYVEHDSPEDRNRQTVRQAKALWNETTSDTTPQNACRSATGTTRLSVTLAGLIARIDIESTASTYRTPCSSSSCGNSR